MRSAFTSIAWGIAGAALLCLAGALSAAAQEKASRLEDTSRLVTIGGSLTEIVYALGEEDRLVARDTTSSYPEEAKALPDVGYMRRLSPEGVLSVDPSAILALEGSGPPETMEVLEKASVPLVIVPETFDRAGIMTKIEVVGTALGVDEKAAELAARVGKDLDAARALTDAIEERKRVLFVLSLQGGKVMASGTGTAASGMIEMSGGVNAITQFEGYKQLTDEAVIKAKPDVILMMSRSDALDTPAEEVFGHPAITATPAARNRQLIRMPGLFLLGFAPRTAEAVRDVARQLYGNKLSN